MVYIIVTSSVFGFKVLIYNFFVVLWFNVNFISVQTVYIRHFFNDLLYLLYSYIWMWMPHDKLIFPEIILKYPQYPLERIWPPFIYIAYQARKSIKIKEHEILLSKKGGCDERQRRSLLSLLFLLLFLLLLLLLFLFLLLSHSISVDIIRYRLISSWR